MKPDVRKLQNALLALVVSVVSLLIADWVFRSFERSQLSADLPAIESDRPVNLAALKYNEGLVTREKVEGEYRILSFGDSFTYSVMEPALSYNGIIADELNQQVPEQSFRVVNLGEPATGPRHFLEAHRYWSQIFEHDAVIFHIFLGNDILDEVYLYGALQWAPNAAVFDMDNPVLKAANPRVPEKFPLRMFDYAWAWWMSRQSQSGEELPEGYNWAGSTSFDDALFNDINYQFLENFDPSRVGSLLAGYEQIVRLFERAAEVSQQGKEVLVVLGPSQPQVDEVVRNAALQTQGRVESEFDLHLAQAIITEIRNRVAPEISLVDLSDSFSQAHQATGERLYFRNNTHWDKAGNVLAGEEIAEAISDLWFGKGEQPQPQAQPGHLAGEIESVMRQLSLGNHQEGPTVSGALRGIQLVDGLLSDGNWALLPLGQPVLIEYRSGVNASAIEIHLYDGESRRYRFTLEGRSGGDWEMLADYSQDEVSGVVSIDARDTIWTAFRITGLDHSGLEQSPDNAFLHVREFTLVEEDRVIEVP